MQLTERVFGYPWRGRGNNCNSYLYAGEKVILIDPGHIQNEFRENCLEVLLQALAKDGFTLENIDLMLCTHSHPDHCEAAVAIKEKKPVNLAMHKDEEPHMELLARFFEQMTAKRPALPRIDLFLQEGELELGAAGEDKIQVLHTPGHSPGSLSFYFPRDKALVTGDAVFNGSIGRTDFPDGSLETLGESVRKLSAVKEVEWLLPGHMQPVKGQAAIENNYRLITHMFF
ncbi:MAG: MBL fold metallo-hydrolase [Dethiobacter sp.]|jgi:glyoxylase-like metal-dependent hydrolase (beta-lactamase superfamily II)|nr:MAG: MBL fold metallo-hydrolase [Dethiobacter sp.]